MSTYPLDAECRSEDPELFFPLPGRGGDLPEAAVAAARTVCARCPVQRACLDKGMAQSDGVWAGTTPNQRRALRRGRVAQAA